MFDPVELAKKTEKIVSRANLRKYYRLRKAPFYGGIATADCVGCCLRCIFCWSWNIINKPDTSGKFYSPEQIADKLIFIANKSGFNQVRISGNEPTLAKEHLLKVIELIPENLMFILETNGILIGHNKNYAKDLSRFKNLHVRVSLKGGNSKEFSKLTGSEPMGFDLQLKSLENLGRFGISHHSAVIDLVKDLKNLNKKLKDINPELLNSLEIEPLIKYPAVMARLKGVV